MRIDTHTSPPPHPRRLCVPLVSLCTWSSVRGVHDPRTKSLGERTLHTRWPLMHRWAHRPLARTDNNNEAHPQRVPRPLSRALQSTLVSWLVRSLACLLRDSRKFNFPPLHTHTHTLALCARAASFESSHNELKCSYNKALLWCFPSRLIARPGSIRSAHKFVCDGNQFGCLVFCCATPHTHECPLPRPKSIVHDSSAIALCVCV